MYDKDATVDDFMPGQTVELHPRLDDWMRGDRFGTVLETRRDRVVVGLHRSGLLRPYLPIDLRHTEV